MREKCTYLSGVLGLCDLKILPSIFLHCTEDMCHRICEDIKDETSIDLLDTHQISELDDAKIAALFDYEEKHIDNLITLVAQSPHEDKKTRNRYNGTAETKFTVANDRIAWAVFWYAIFLSVSAIGFVLLLVVYPIAPQNVRFADTALGYILGSMISPVISFYFGSSMKKTDYHSLTQKQRLINEEPSETIKDTAHTTSSAPNSPPNSPNVPKYRPGSSNPDRQ